MIFTRNRLFIKIIIKIITKIYRTKATVFYLFLQRLDLLLNVCEEIYFSFSAYSGISEALTGVDPIPDQLGEACAIIFLMAGPVFAILISRVRFLLVSFGRASPR